MTDEVYIAACDTEVYHLNEACDNLQRAADYRTAWAEEVEDLRACGYGDCAAEKDGRSSPYETLCPLCGDTTKKNQLRDHLPNCDGEFSSIETDPLTEVDG